MDHFDRLAAYGNSILTMTQQVAEQVGADTSETFLDTEERARKLAEANPCLVPEMSNELYDCCGSDTIEATCTAFGSINAVVMAGIVLSWIYLVIKNDWFRSQLLLSFTFLFQLLPGLWRTWFYLSAGW